MWPITEYNARYEVLQALEKHQELLSVITTTYAYDPAGNRIEMATNRGAGPGPLPPLERTLYTYDAANHLLAAGDVTYTYDLNGNRLTKYTPGPLPSQDRLETYQYDTENRMVLYTRLRAGSGLVEQRVYNQYDGPGRRLNKGWQRSSGDIHETEYVLDGLGYDPLAEYPQTGAPRVQQMYRGQGNQIVSLHEMRDNAPNVQYLAAHRWPGQRCCVHQFQRPEHARTPSTVIPAHSSPHR